ncbi:hypothetical protein [Umezawaea sp. NPDC059074]|uniref:hypothetical protein n=1 Tax=Umezawaea sp. NPDC059074 TaxID=3346716 RepID=UPI00367820A1
MQREQVRQTEGDQGRDEVPEDEDERRGGGSGEPFQGDDDERHEQERPQDVRQVVGAEQARGETPPVAVEQVGTAVAGRLAQSRDESGHEAAQPEREGNGNA